MSSAFLGSKLSVLNDVSHLSGGPSLGGIVVVFAHQHGLREGRPSKGASFGGRSLLTAGRAAGLADEADSSDHNQAPHDVENPRIPHRQAPCAVLRDLLLSESGFQGDPGQNASDQDDQQQDRNGNSSRGDAQHHGLLGAKRSVLTGLQDGFLCGLPFGSAPVRTRPTGLPTGASLHRLKAGSASLIEGQVRGSRFPSVEPRPIKTLRPIKKSRMLFLTICLFP